MEPATPGQQRERYMQNAIKVLRSTADDYERRARTAKESLAKAELFDITARLHYLAGEAEKLCQRELEIEVQVGLCVPAHA
jgi:hypothetical protein